MIDDEIHLEIIDITEEPDENGNHKLTIETNRQTTKFLASYGLRHILITAANKAIKDHEMYESDLYGPLDEGC
jgi:hypothetical protein